jgi:hypothetical protein
MVEEGRGARGKARLNGLTPRKVDHGDSSTRSVAPPKIRPSKLDKSSISPSAVGKTRKTARVDGKQSPSAKPGSNDKVARALVVFKKGSLRKPARGLKKLSGQKKVRQALTKGNF